MFAVPGPPCPHHPFNGDEYITSGVGPPGLGICSRPHRYRCLARVSSDACVLRVPTDVFGPLGFSGWKDSPRTSTGVGPRMYRSVSPTRVGPSPLCVRGRRRLHRAHCFRRTTLHLRVPAVTPVRAARTKSKNGRCVTTGRSGKLAGGIRSGVPAQCRKTPLGGN